MAKELIVKRVDWGGRQTIEDLDWAMEEYSLLLHEVDCVDWPEQFPSRPRVEFRIAHSGDEIFIKFYVCEKELRATYAQDNGRPWTDSCVEFFFSPGTDGDGTYYNLEMACNGFGILHGKTPDGRTLDHEIVGRVRRLSSLGTEAFGVRKASEEGDVFCWTLTVAIPVDVFSLTEVPPLSGRTTRGNFYKCGDLFSVPHYLSWSPIATERPSFHQPEFFGELHFE